MVDITYRSPEVLVDSLSSPTTWDPITCPADGKITLDFTPEITADKSIEIFFRSVDSASWVHFAAGGSLSGIWLRYWDGATWHDVENHFGIFTDGVPTSIVCTYVGTSIIITVDGVEKINNTVNYNLSITNGWLTHNLVTNDIEIEVFTLPAPASVELQANDFTVGKTYFLRADGTAANKEAATSDAAASTSMSIATHNSETITAGSVIVVSDAGGTYRGTTFQPKTGAAGLVTKYQANSGGSPVLSAAALITGWTNDSGNVWKASLATQPYQVWVDGAFGDRKTSKTLTNNYDWFWDDPTNTLYLYDSAGDPDNHVSPGVEGCSLQYGLEMQNVSYVEFSGLTIEKAWYCGVYGVGCRYLTFNDCTFQWCWADGLILGTTAINPALNHITIEDCVARYNAAQGISLTATDMYITDCTIRRNRCYENGRHQFANPVWEVGHNYTGGIKFWTLELTALRNVVEQNIIYNNGPAAGAFGTGMGGGIWFDYASGTNGNENHIRHNLIYGNSGCALYNEVSSYNLWYSNVCYDNATTLDAGVWSVGTIRCDARGGDDASYNKFYNNTCYGGLYGIICLSTSQEAGTELNGNEFKNNIVAGYTNRALYADTGGDNDGANGTGNVYNANCFGAQAAGFINWNATAYATYDAWLAASSQLDNNVEVDPSFQDAGSDQYWLKTGSPCIDAGVNLGSPYNVGLGYDSVWPSAVTAVNQSGAWDLGAYPYSNPQGGTGITSRYRHFLRRKRHHGILMERSR